MSSLIIKLIYGSEIRDEINETFNFHIDRVRTSNLEGAAQEIFNNYHWKSGIFEGAKKEAIKDILRAEVHAHRAGQLVFLLDKANGLSQGNSDQSPVHIERLSYQLQNEFQAFDLYEIRHILELPEVVRKDLGNIPSYYCTSIFNKIHKAAKEELYASKTKFRELNRALFEKTKTPINIINQNVQEAYEKLFGKLDTHQGLPRALDSIHPEIRMKIIQTTFDAQIRDLVKNAMWVLPKDQLENIKPRDYLRHIKGICPLDCITQAHVYSAALDLSFGAAFDPQKNEFRAKLFSIMHSLSDRSAQKILNYLEAPTPEKYTMLLPKEIHLVETMTSMMGKLPLADLKTEISIITNNEYNEALNGFLPKRPSHLKNIDLNIIAYCFSKIGKFAQPISSKPPKHS